MGILQNERAKIGLCKDKKEEQGEEDTNLSHIERHDTRPNRKVGLKWSI